MSIGVGGDTLQLARREIEQPHEVVDDAVQLGVADEAAEPGVNLEAAGRIDMLEHSHRNGGEPYLRPRQRGRGKKRDRLPAKDLVADRLFGQNSAPGTYHAP